MYTRAGYVIAILLMTAAVAWADRDPRKCGKVVLGRIAAAQMHRRATIKVPRGCRVLAFPAPFEIKGRELWLNGRRVVSFADPRNAVFTWKDDNGVTHFTNRPEGQ